MNNTTLNNNLEELLLSIPNCVNFNSVNQFEVKPDRYSPIYIDVKTTLNNFLIRERVLNKLLELVDKNYDYVCGVESGGSYYGCALADKLRCGLILYRTKSKEYGLKGNIVGKTPKAGSKVLLIDDVLATGTLVIQAKNYLENLNCEVFALFVFSYGFESLISKKHNIQIKCGCDWRKLAKLIISKKFFNEKEMEDINKNLESCKQRI